jgi:hypothetical protein
MDTFVKLSLQHNQIEREEDSAYSTFGSLTLLYEFKFSGNGLAKNVIL